MAKIYKDETVTETKRQFVKMVCDICGRESEGYDWATDAYEVDETTVKHKKGRNYPEGGSGTKIEPDICPTCFEEKLVPFLRSQGANVEEEEWDW